MAELDLSVGDKAGGLGDGVEGGVAISLQLPIRMIAINGSPSTFLLL